MASVCSRKGRERPGGALVATAGIFLPAFVFVALSGPLVPRLRSSPVALAMVSAGLAGR